MQDAELFKMCFGSFVIWVKPKSEVVISTLKSLAVNISVWHWSFLKLQTEMGYCLQCVPS